MDIRDISNNTALELIKQYHKYGSLGKVQTYILGYYEGEKLIAVFCFNPPAPGAALSVCPDAPHAVLSLSRMVAIPIAERIEKKLSKVLRYVMTYKIDRTRYPVIITYSDSSLGHTGKTYLYARMKKTAINKRAISVNDQGQRVSTYAGGSRSLNKITGYAILTRWESWACGKNDVEQFLAKHGWRRKPIIGKKWASGKQAYEIVKDD